jgi:peptide/nickel transport system ATP-binding protein
MLDVTLQGVASSARRGARALEPMDITFRKGLHTALAGDAASGVASVLALVAGDVQPSIGDVIFGTRSVVGMKRAKRPVLLVGAQSDAPLRWSVAHALVAAVRGRTLDREDRQSEIAFASTKWELEPLMTRTLRDLSSDEQLRVHLATIELTRPGVLVADRLLERATPSVVRRYAREFHRALRVMGTTLIYSAASDHDLAECDEVVVLDGGVVVQKGPLATVYRTPVSEASARATGSVNVVPLEVRHGRAEAAIGSWEFSGFEGNGIALCRPEDFVLAEKGEESDVILATEEARFRDGSWYVSGNLSGGVLLTVALPAEQPIARGRLLALRYDPSRFTVLSRDQAMPGGSSVPTDVIPSRADSR